MKLLYEGKTKNVYELDKKNVVLKFKDDVTGTDGVFDPGANTVGLSIEGIGKKSLRMTEFFFKKLEQSGIPTHYVSSDLAENTMVVKNATLFGKGLEIICRFKSVGSFLRRYGMYTNEGDNLASFVEFTLKDDARNDPPITKDALSMLKIMTEAEYEDIKKQTIKIAEFVRDELKKFKVDLYDIKFEFGRVTGSNDIVLIDEISGGNMRVYANGEYIMPEALYGIMFKD